MGARSRVTTRLRRSTEADARWSLAFGAAGAVGILAFVAEPWPGATWPVFTLVASASAAAVVVGVRRWRPSQVTPWWFAVVGLGFVAVAGSLTPFEPEAATGTDGAALSDAIEMVGFGLAIVSAMLLIRVKHPGRDIDGFLDGAILGLAVLILAWVLVLGPRVEDGADLGAMLLIGSYAMVDLILLAVISRIARTPDAADNATYQLICIGLLVTLVADLALLVRGPHPGVEDRLTDAGTLVAFVCIGAAALLPSIRRLSEPVAPTARPVHPARIAFCAVAALVPSIVLFTHELSPGDRRVVGVASFVLALLVVIRVTRLIRGREHELLARQVLEHRLSFGATHDTLTGLGNRAWLMERLEDALAVADRDGCVAGALAIDLDNFRSVNDGFGHMAGNQVLVQVVARILATLGDNDSLARFGGDEFMAVVARDGGIDDVLAVGHELARVIATPIAIDGNDVFITATIGIASTVEHGGDPDGLIRDADAALLGGKERGRNHVVLCDDEMHDRLEQRLQVEAELRSAAERGELRLLYQPEVDLETGELFGVEALVRWQHPTEGLLTPDRFLPVAERTGLVAEIGSWVIDEACRQSAEWRMTLGAARTPVISVNVSPIQLSRADVPNEILDALTRHGLSPRSIRVEVTETAVLSDVTATAGALAAIRAAGVVIAVDDFGTGYFSLRDLVRYPIDIIKVDQTFVAGLGQGGTEEAIVVSTLGLAKALGLQVVAEGVETVEQADELRRLGCDVGQGYLYARPLPAEQIGAFVAPVPTRDGSPRCHKTRSNPPTSRTNPSRSTT